MNQSYGFWKRELKWWKNGKAYLYSWIAPIGNEDIIERVDRDSGGRVELAFPLSIRAETVQKVARRIEHLTGTQSKRNH